MIRKPNGDGCTLTRVFVKHHLDMLESPAWRALTLASLQVLARLEIEHLRQDSNRNGRLIVTYAQFLDHMGRKSRHVVAAAIEQAQRLGFLEVAERGKWNRGKDR